MVTGGSDHAKGPLKRSQEDSGDRKKKKRPKTEKKEKKVEMKKEELDRVIHSLENYGSCIVPPVPGTPVNRIVEVLPPPITAMDGLHRIDGGAGANPLPTMITHAQGDAPCPFTAGTTFSYLTPITSTAMYDALPVGGHLYAFWQSPGWPDASYLAIKIS